ncbi:hypothetical protein PJP07_30050, partial [Mycobacterium kansasii]
CANMADMQDLSNLLGVPICIDVLAKKLRPIHSSHGALNETAMAIKSIFLAIHLFYALWPT